MVSLKDIAARCGVSAATVSKALNDQQDVSSETKERIRAVAQEMGYMTNLAARSLKTNRTYNIGILFVDEQNSGLAHDYFSSVLDSLKVEAEGRGYDITFINRNIGNRSTTYLQHCQNRGVDGVVIACVDFNDPQVQELVNSHLPVVTIDHVFNNRIAVISDNVNGLETLTKHLYSMGHRKIAFIHGEKTAVTENRLTGFYRAAEELDLDIPSEYVRTSAYHDTEGCQIATRELLNLPDPPTCIIFPDDYSAIGGINEIQQSGLRVPEDISVAGYDGINLSQILNPPLTTYKQDTKVLGKTAAARLIELIEHPRTTILDRVFIPGKLLVGRSVKELN